MKRVLVHFVLVVFAFSTAYRLQAQHLFYNEIAAFKKQDSISQPPKGAILFVGSSSFRLWEGLDTAFPGHQVINRGFGGSTLPDVVYYAEDIIFSYQPRQIVIYAGDNDLATSDRVTAQVVFDRFSQLYKTIRSRMYRRSICFMSPSSPVPAGSVSCPAWKKPII